MELRFRYMRIRATQTINSEGGLIWMGPHRFVRALSPEVENSVLGSSTANAIARLMGRPHVLRSELEIAFDGLMAWCATELRDQVNWAHEGLHTVVIHDDHDAAAFRLRWC